VAAECAGKPLNALCSTENSSCWRRAGALTGFAAAALLAACSIPTALGPRALLPPTARAVPQQFIVVTVRNPLTPPSLHAASSTRGYDGIGFYQAGGSARSAGRVLARKYGLREVSSWPIALLGVHCLVYQIPSGSDAAVLRAALAHDPVVESVQALQSFDTASNGYNDPYASLQGNVERMGVLQAQALSRGGGVRVAVIDTGVELDHPDLPSSAKSANFVDNDGRAFGLDVHGTAVAGVIAAIPNNGIGIIGVAPDVQLLLYKACWRTTDSGPQAVCNSFTLAQALAAAIDANADVINLSLAGPSDPLLTRLVQRAIDRRTIVVGAVPPDGLRRSFPADIPAVIAVDAVENGIGHGSAGEGIVRAPGHEILSLAPQGHYDFYSGSSLATAEVSGLVALLRAERHDLSARDAELLLTESAAPQSQEPSVPNACVALATLLHRADCH
jgi:subtilisin family serine protease